MATIYDIARAAQVSIATVSRVVNNSGNVSPVTREKVLKAIQRMDYVPNDQARNLRAQHSGTILVMQPNITNPYYANVFSGVSDKAKNLNYTLFLMNTEEEDLHSTLEKTLENKQFDGVITFAVNREDDWIADYLSRIPIVQCCEFAEKAAVPHVSVDNYKAAYTATDYLLRLGRKRIGMISTTNHFMSTKKRMEGFRDALAARDGEPLLIAYMDDAYSYASSLVTAQKLLRRDDPPDAVFCIGDAAAFALIVTARELGIRVPDELSVIGFDDVIYTQMIHPYITTMRQPCAALGARAMDILNEMINGRMPEEKEVILPTALIVRESTSPA